jgi:hypothetical protein
MMMVVPGIRRFVHPFCRIFERSALGPLPPNARPRRSFGLVAVRLLTLLGCWLRAG